MVPFRINETTVYRPEQVDMFVRTSVDPDMLSGLRSGVDVYDVAASFDIETTSFYHDGNRDLSRADYERMGCPSHMEKRALMYVWQLGINGAVMVGRTWGEFADVCSRVVSLLGLGKKRRLIVYVHNLSFEFQFIRRRFEWDKVFSNSLRKPIYARTVDGLEFRCSYLLSGYALGMLHTQVTRYDVRKATGDLDYSLMRNSATPLTDTELGYCVDDVRMVMAYIQELIERYGGLRNLPITNTGFVRSYCRRECFAAKGYRSMIHRLTLDGLNEFDMLQRAFAGGFTHANANHAMQVVRDVSSYDFTSSYPAVMVCERFPMSAGVHVTAANDDELRFYLNECLSVFDVEFENIRPRPDANEHIISTSKCFIKDDYLADNGRLVSAARIVTTITNVDLKSIDMFYQWDAIRFIDMYVYRAAYLPTPFVRSILKLYADKTTLKGVEGREVEYMQSKGMLNSCYGMAVTNPLRDEVVYSDVEGWGYAEDVSRETLLDQYNKNPQRFLFYPWGVFVTAYARRNLYTGILEAGADYVYSDTDSVKLQHADAHAGYFERYNAECIGKLQRAASYHDIPLEQFAPCTIKGDARPLGVWDFEGTYSRFKTLGAKRYMVEEPHALKAGGEWYDVSITVSGVNKRAAVPWMLETFGSADACFDAFTEWLHVPAGKTGKLLHTYVDERMSGETVDHMGNTAPYDELSAVHLEPTDYTLSIAVMYARYLMGIRSSDVRI